MLEHLEEKLKILRGRRKSWNKGEREAKIDDNAIYVEDYKLWTGIKRF